MSNQEGTYGERNGRYEDGTVKGDPGGPGYPDAQNTSDSPYGSSCLAILLFTHCSILTALVGMLLS